MLSPNEILKKYWGFEKLRPAQEKAIDNILKNQDVIALLPTGAGKSMCFQIPALMKKGICIVISPLISLMQDQVESLRERNIKAMSLSGSIPFSELIRKLDNCLYGNFKFLYLSPERLQQEIVLEYIKEMQVNLIAVDEAHCISEWGHDFRPAYREIKILKELQPEVPLIALTATATKKVLLDIKSNLELEKAQLIKLSFERPNISLLILKSEDKNYELRKFLLKNPGVSIVYVRSRKLTIQLKNFLNHNGFSAEAFHGGMNSDMKNQLLNDWQTEKFDIMVATNAFGMGIDKANVRNVVHYQLPDSLENYYQEAGRAGRDGKESKALLIYDSADILRLKDQFLKNAPTPESVKLIYKKLNSYFSIAYGEGTDQEFNFNFLDFCHTYNLNTFLAYNVLQQLDQLEILNLSREFKQRTELLFKIPNKELYFFLEHHRYFQPLINTLLRMQGGFFTYKTTIDLKFLEVKTGLSRAEINDQLKKLEALEVIDLTLADQDSTIVFLVPREDNFTINPLIPYIKQYYISKKHKIDQVINFVENDEICKNILLLNYFGEKIKKDCKKCSNCLIKYKPTSSSKNQYQQIQQDIISYLKKHSETDIKQLMIELNFNEVDILYVLRQMLDRNRLLRTPQNTFILNLK